MMGKISQPDFVDLVERLNLSSAQARYARQVLGIDSTPLRMSDIAKGQGIKRQGVSFTMEKVKAAIGELPYAPVEITRNRKAKPWAFRNPRPLQYKAMMTVKKAEAIIGSAVGVGEPDRVDRHRFGWVRVACIDAFGETLSETARNIPEALALLIRSNYARSREFVLERDGYRCTNCGKTGAMQCDHVIMRSHGRVDQPENMTSLCSGCHEIRHRTRGFHNRPKIDPLEVLPDPGWKSGKFDAGWED